MSYAAQQESEYGGEPEVIYRFSAGPRAWLYCNRRRPLTLGSEVYEPAAIKHSKVEQNLAESPSGTTITLPSNSPLAQEFKAYLPPQPIVVRIMSRHRTDAAAQFVTLFSGECASGEHNPETGESAITCRPTASQAQRTVPWPVYCSGCNWSLFSQACGVDRELFKVQGTVQTVADTELTSAAFATKPDGWFAAGFVVRDATGELRWIEGHAGSKVTLSAAFVGLQPGEALTAFAGCDGLESTCSGKFNNLPNFAGFPDVPRRNPFTDNLFGTGSPGAAAAAVKEVMNRFRSMRAR